MRNSFYRLMVEVFEGIVLRTLRYSDSLMLADVYTLQKGRMSLLVPVTHSKRGRVRNVLFQPLAMLSLTVSYKQSRQLQRVTAVQPYRMYSSIPFNVVKSAIALYLSEVLVYALREEERNDALFMFLNRSFLLFDELGKGYADFHIVFLSQLLHHLGIYPNIDDYAEGCYFDLVQGCTLKAAPLHANFLKPQDAGYFVSLMRVEYETMHLLSLNRELRGCYLAILNLYYRLHVPDFPQIKSMEILKELFD